MDITGFNQELLAAVEKSAYREKKIVFGHGDPHAKLVLVGEAPGGEEEKQGRPFVGKAGKNLEEFLQALEIKRNQLYITNVVKLRPTGVSKKTGGLINRPPNKGELAFFLGFLHQELNLVQPELVITLGNTALKAVSGDEAIIGECHGRLLEKNGYHIFPLYHPASIIYNRALKDVYDEDLKVLKTYV